MTLKRKKDRKVGGGGMKGDQDNFQQIETGK